MTTYGPDRRPNQPEFPVLPLAACTDVDQPDAFFSDHAWQLEQARNICRRCPELRPCLAWALTHKEQGIWAGTTDTQRAELRARHARTAS